MSFIKGRSVELKTPLMRFSFVNCLVPQDQEKERDGKLIKVKTWNLVGLVAKSVDLSTMHEAAFAAAKEAWNDEDKIKKWLKEETLKTPFLDGDGKQAISKKNGERYDGYAGHTFVRFATERAPKMVTQKMQPVTTEDELYSGCYGYIVTQALAYDHPKSGKGISFGLNMLQVAKHGEKFGGQSSAPEEHFEKIEDEGDAPSSTKEGKGAAGLFG